MSTDITNWLRSLGLEQYSTAFLANDIDAKILPELTADDLIALGVMSVGHRRKLLAAVATLRDGSPISGAPVSSIEPVRQGGDAGIAAGSAERRQLTVLFCDLVGSTALASRLDPEDLRELLGAYHAAVAEVVSQFGGYVAKYMGDGVLAYFGYPQAHEHDAEQAVRAGLALVDRVSRLESGATQLASRIGIATGLVVVGDLIGSGVAREQAVVGDTPNLAARLQAFAEPNAVVIAAATRRLIGNLFEYRDLGAVEVKGLARPVQAWQVLRPSIVESRFEALRGSALTPLVGRHEEIDLLLRRWGRAKAGDGQVVLVSGEPGIGKSRITAALVERLHGEAHIRLRYFCSPYRQGSALFPFIDQLGRAAGFVRDDTPPAKLEKLECLLARAAPPPEDVAFLADLLSLPASERRPLPDLSPERKKQRTLEALMRQLEGLARQKPVVMVFEDAHWIDPTSRELLDLTVEHLRTMPVLLLITFRPEFQPPWAGLPQVMMLALNRLDRKDRTTLVAQITGGRALPDEVVDQIADRTDGVPLFVEELTKTVLESGLLHAETGRYVLDGALPPLAIPTTLHDSLMARLDRLASVKRVAQIGAAIGREFSYTLLRIVSGLYEDELRAALGRLVNTELVFQRGTPPDAMYSFKHALIQDAAHGSLLRGTRQQLHARIAEAFEAHFPEVMETQPELLAHHYTEAGMMAHAIPYWQRAGERAIGRSANVEAVHYLTRALGLLNTLPSTTNRTQQELVLLTTLGPAFMAVKGYTAPEAEQTYARARELCQQVGETPQLISVLRGLHAFYFMRGELQTAHELGEQCLALSRHVHAAAPRLSAHYVLGLTLCHLGELVPARKHLEQGIALHDPQRRHSHRALQDSGVACLSYTAMVLWPLGYPDQALKRSQEALTLVQELSHPFSVAYALNWAAWIHQYRREEHTTRERAEAVIALASEQGLAFYVAQGTMMQGWALAEQGHGEEGIAQLHKGLAAYRAIGAETGQPSFLAMLTAGYQKCGQTEAGLAALAEALARVDTTGERWYEPELHRLRGVLLLEKSVDNHATAQACFQQALTVARCQQAKSWELRATMSLARLWQQQGKRTDAHELLAPIYGWFTEGFDTSDLKEAKALLDQLA